MDFYASDYTLYFCFGILAYYAWDFCSARITVSWRTPLAITAVVYGAFYISFSLSGKISGLLATLPGGAYVGWLMPLGLILLALLMHSAMLRASNKTFLLLGDASYSLYLTHLIVLQQLIPLSEALPLLNYKTQFFGVLVALIVTTVVAVAVFYLVERPLHRLLTMPFRGAIRGPALVPAAVMYAVDK